MIWPRKKTVELSCWITFDQRGINRMYKGRPGLHAGEKAIQVRLSVPRSVFREPDLVASISLRGELPEEHKIELLADVQEALDSIPHIHVSVPDLAPKEPQT